MTRARDGERPATEPQPRRATAPAFVLGVILLGAACGGQAATPASPAPAASGPASGPASGFATSPGSPAPADSARPAAIGSPVTGRLTRIASEGLTRVRGFTLRLEDGAEVAFTIGRLENGVEFPPGHLAEHMSTSTAVRVYFHDEGGQRVVYRLEDGE